MTITLTDSEWLAIAVTLGSAALALDAADPDLSAALDQARHLLRSRQCQTPAVH